MLLNDSIYRHLTGKDKRALCDVMSILNATNDFLTKDPTLSKGFKFRCHSLCDAIAANVKGVKVVDGYYMGLKHIRSKRLRERGQYFTLIKCHHSWLQTENGSVIDPYPVGCLNINPLYIPSKGKYSNFGKSFYMSDPKVGKAVRKRWLWKETVRWTSIMRRAKHHQT